ncbi:hypothetical protein H0H87_011610, partial [Tephrocybe sp. NHM501043]
MLKLRPVEDALTVRVRVNSLNRKRKPRHSDNAIAAMSYIHRVVDKEMSAHWLTVDSVRATLKEVQYSGARKLGRSFQQTLKKAIPDLVKHGYLRFNADHTKFRMSKKLAKMYVRGLEANERVPGDEVERHFTVCDYIRHKISPVRPTYAMVGTEPWDDIARLAEVMEAPEATVESITETYRARTEAYRALQEEHKSLQGLYRDLEESCDVNRGQIQGLREEVREHRERRRECEEALSDVREKHRALMERYEALEERHQRECLGQKAALEEEMKRLREHVDKAISDCEEKEAVIKGLEGDLNVTKEMLESAWREVAEKGEALLAARKAEATRMAAAAEAARRREEEEAEAAQAAQVGLERQKEIYARMVAERKV